MRLVCDNGCGAFVYGLNGKDVREVAEAQGWRFPNSLLASGRPSVSTHDVCVDCAPTFEPRPTRKRSKRWDGMSKEERRLTAFLQMNRDIVSAEERIRLEAQLDEIKAAKQPGARE